MIDALRRRLTLRREVFSSSGTIIDVGAGDRLRGTVGLDIVTADGVDILGDARRLPFGTGTADGVVCYHLIEHLKPHEAVLAISEFNRVLKPGGRLYLLVDRDVSQEALFEKDPTHVYRYIPEMIRNYMEEGDWQVDIFQTHNLLGNVHNHPLTWWKYISKATKIYIEATATEPEIGNEYRISRPEIGYGYPKPRYLIRG